MQEYIHRLPSHYVNEDKGCAQVMLPYQITMTLFNKDGIQFNQNNNQHAFINEYLNNMKRYAFPYHNIPNHIRRNHFFGRTNVTNQLFNFNEHYITITDGRAIDRCVLFDQGEALMLTKILPKKLDEDETEFKSKKIILTRDELDEFFRPKNENEKTYLAATNNGDIFNGETVTYNTEDEFVEAKKKRIEDEFNRIRNQFSEESIKFFEEKISTMSTSDLKDIILYPSVYLIRMNGTEISIELIIARIISSNKYELLIKKLPLNKYVLEQFKYMAPNIFELKEPKISLKLNQGITKEDVKKAKEMVLSMRNQ